MSGSHLVEQSPEVTVKPEATDPSAEGSAASLRAVALLTLKSKKRKNVAPSPGHFLPPRSLAAPPSIQLDYGSEEPSGATSSPAVEPTLQPVAVVTSTPEPMEVDGVQSREEGEISDSETTPPTPKIKPGISSEIPTTSPIQLKVEPLSPSLSFATAPRAPASILPPVPSTLIDESHIRPGLALTQAQYDSAKDIVLDLLGWGVPPEYLVNCGLSREIILYVFVELNLRLPSNLDVAGLAPHIVFASSNLPSTTTVLQAPHPSLPAKPQAVRETSSSLSAAATPFFPGGNSVNGLSPSAPSLSDMELQRKQELLARKAVLASRKLKQQKSTSGMAVNANAAFLTAAQGDSSTSKPVPHKTVDDFLNSIEPAGSSGSAPMLSKSAAPIPKPPSRTFSIDDMDVDEIPGLSGGLGPITDYTPIPRPAPSIRPPDLSNSRSPRSPAAPSSAISTSSERSLYMPSFSAINGSLPYGSIDDDADAIPGLFQRRSPSEESQIGSGRRGIKRPVAADFVDMEPVPSRHARGPPADSLRPHVRRKTTGFVGVTQRRCIIELSDSEDEDEDMTQQPNGLPSRADSRGPKTVTPVASVIPTPPIHSPATTLVNPTALLEKEEQIRRMRELIARREQNRLKKVTSVSSRSTPLSSDIQTNAASIKQEEEDSVPTQSLPPSRSSSSSTPSERPSESRDEHSVLDALLPHELDGNGAILLPDSAFTSNSATPIEVVSNALEHPTTGDKVLTDEAQQEQVARIFLSLCRALSGPSYNVLNDLSFWVMPEEHPDQVDNSEVDVVGMRLETSAQVAQDTDINEHRPQQTPAFQRYSSVLDRHPLLRAHLRPDLNYSLPSSVAALAGSSSSITDTNIDLKPLKQAAVLKYLSDSTASICQYELGGECRDKDCKNVHLSRLSAVEPSDEDTAQYLCASIPAGQRYGVEVFRKALDIARLSHPTVSFEARIEEALTRLGLR